MAPPKPGRAQARTRPRKSLTVTASSTHPPPLRLTATVSVSQPLASQSLDVRVARVRFSPLKGSVHRFSSVVPPPQTLTVMFVTPAETDCRI